MISVDIQRDDRQSGTSDQARVQAEVATAAILAAELFGGQRWAVLPLLPGHRLAGLCVLGRPVMRTPQPVNGEAEIGQAQRFGERIGEHQSSRHLASEKAFSSANMLSQRGQFDNCVFVLG